MKNKNFKNGFTLIEILVLIGIFSVLLGLSVSFFRVSRRASNLANAAEETLNILRLAQSKTLSSEGLSQWGVFFDNSVVPNRMVIFKGSSFAARDVSADDERELSESVEIYDISLVGQSETVFSRLTGLAVPAGYISLRLKSEPSEIKSVFIDGSGKIDLSSSFLPSDASRIKDSRHVHFDYSRDIDAATEDLILTFSDPPNPDTVQIIVIADNLADGQIYWEGQVSVSGENQEIKIQTHRLNSLDSQFSLHRDRRYNNKALRLELSADPSGNLIQYQSNGQTIQGSSIYAASPIWQ